MGKEVSWWAGIIAAALQLQMRQVYTVQAGSCASATWDAGDGGVLP